MRDQVPVRLGPGPRAIRTSRVVKRFGKETALSGLNMEVPKGAVYVLVGPNGSGKTTTLRILLDLLRPDQGHAEVAGMPTHERSDEIRAQIGYVPERRDFHYGWMKVRDMLEFHAGYYPAWDRGYARELQGKLEIRVKEKYARLSKGQARRVQLLLALAHRPPLLILDEPTDGLDPVGRKEVLGLLAEHLASTATTTLVSTHLIYEAERLGDHLGVLHDGRLTAQVDREDLGAHLKRYLVASSSGGDPGIEAGVNVVSRERSAGERSADRASLIVWGREEEVVQALEGAGASVRAVSPLSLEEAALALLGRTADDLKVAEVP